MNRRAFMTTSVVATGAIAPFEARGDDRSSGVPIFRRGDESIYRATILGVDNVPILKRVVHVAFESHSMKWDLQVWRGRHYGLFQEDTPGHIHMGRPDPEAPDPPHWPRPIPSVMPMADYALVRFGDLMVSYRRTLRKMVTGYDPSPTLVHMVFECTDDVRSHAFVYLMEDAPISNIKLVELHDVVPAA